MSATKRTVKRIPPLTKEDLTYIVTNWPSMLSQDIADELDRPLHYIHWVVKMLREEGFDMPKKTSGTFLKSLISEFAKENPDLITKK